MIVQIRNWQKHQHYKGRRPPWVKLYRDLLDDEEFHLLSPQAAKTLMLLWLLASEDESMQGLLPSKKKIAFRLRMTEKLLESSLSELSHWVVQDASTLQADCQQLVPSEDRGQRPELETRERDQRTDSALAAQSLMVDTVVNLWNKIPGVVKPKSITGPIRKRLLACLDKQPELLWWTTYFDKIKDSAFLTGRKTDFAATLDWVLGPKNMAKILAGNYDDRAPVIKESAIMEQARAFLGRV